MELLMSHRISLDPLNLYVPLNLFEYKPTSLPTYFNSWVMALYIIRPLPSPLTLLLEYLQWLHMTWVIYYHQEDSAHRLIDERNLLIRGVYFSFAPSGLSDGINLVEMILWSISSLRLRSAGPSSCLSPIAENTLFISGALDEQPSMLPRYPLELESFKVIVRLQAKQAL